MYFFVQQDKKTFSGNVHMSSFANESSMALFWRVRMLPIGMHRRCERLSVVFHSMLPYFQ
jgi:hypothetical protein